VFFVSPALQGWANEEGPAETIHAPQIRIIRGLLREQYYIFFHVDALQPLESFFLTEVMFHGSSRKVRVRLFGSVGPAS